MCVVKLHWTRGMQIIFNPVVVALFSLEDVLNCSSRRWVELLYFGSVTLRARCRNFLLGREAASSLRSAPPAAGL